MTSTSHTPSDAPVISLRGAGFGYAERTVVSGIDLTIHRGEVVAILGPNGSGKSTVVKGLLGLADHTEGEARLFGTPISAFRERWRLGYVPQRHTLATSVRSTVEEVVAIGRVSRTPWWAPWQAGSAANRHLVQDSLERVGLVDRRSEDVTSLSGGQQRRVLIARALASQPDALLMDEPTAGVDHANQRVLGQVLGRLADTGTTMVIVTHELEAIRDVVTRAVVIDSGHVVHDGPADTIDQTVAGEHVHHDYGARRRTLVQHPLPAEEDHHA